MGKSARCRQLAATLKTILTASGMGRVQISYGLGGSVGRCKVLCDLKDGVPRGSESAERPPLLVLEEQRLASKVIDVEAT